MKKSLYEVTGDIKDLNTLLVQKAEYDSLVKREPVAWLNVEAQCISTSTHMRDHWLSKGKTVEPLYK